MKVVENEINHLVSLIVAHIPLTYTEVDIFGCQPKVMDTRNTCYQFSDLTDLPARARLLPETHL